MKTFASLFTGGGLADVGAMAAGYELLWGVELCPDIAAVANANLPHRDTVHSASVIGFDWASLESPDHLHMSPPCQDHSVAKTTGKVSNDNDGLAAACIDALAALQPGTVTLENVEGYRKANGFQRIVDWLWGAGYWVNVDVLNSADFGVPQTRRRLILRAVRGGFPGPLPEPVKWRGWYEAIEDLIPELPETQFAAWQLERLGKLFDGNTWLVQRQPGARGDGVRAVDEPAKTYCSTDIDPKAVLSELNQSTVVHSNNQRAMTTRGEDEPLFTVMANSGDRLANLPKAYLISSNRDATQRADAEPSTTVVCVGDGHSVAPKALLVNSAFPGSNGKKHYTADEPSFTADTTSLGRMKALLVDDKNNESLGIDYLDPASAVRVGNGVGNIKATTPAGRVVRMTPRCLARFQSVPDWYVLPEKRALACKIIGNGVPSLMMQRVLESFTP